MKLPRAGGRYFVRLTCCLLVIATIPPLVLGAILFGNARQNMSRQMALFSQNYLGQTLNAMEVVFSQIEDSGRQTILDSSFKTFETFTDGKGMEELISSLEVGENLRGTARYLEAKARMLEQLRSFELTNAFIDSIYFCDSGKGLVYSSAGLQYGMADFFDKEWFGYADQAFISPAVMDTRTVDFPYKGNQQVITLVFRSYYNEMNLMAVNIDARKFYDQIVLKIERKGTDSLFAYSGEGELLLKDYRYPELQQLIQRERVDAFRDGQYHWDSGKLGRKRYLLSYLESDKLGWNFVMVSDVQQLYQGVEALQMVFLLSLAGVTACVILAAAVASRRLYSPIERLMEIVGESPRKSGWKNEFDGLAGVFEELKMNEMDLVERLQNSLPVHRRRFLISLLRRNDYSEEEVRRQFKLLNIGLDDRSLRIVLFSYDALEEGDRFGPLSIKKDLLLSYLLDNLRPYPFELAEMEDGKVVALLNAAEGDTAQLMDKLEGMRRELARAAQIPCTVVLSGQIGEVGELRRAYLEAERALLRRELSDEDGVLFADAPAGEKGVLRYSQDRIDKILDALQSGEGEKACRAFRELLKELMQENDPLEYRQVQSLYMDVLTSVVKLVNAAGVPPGRVYGDTRNLYDELLRLDGIGAALKWFDGVLTATADCLGTLATKKSDARVEQVLAIIRADCSQNTTLESVAQQLNLNPAYVSRIFKKETGVKFMDYLTGMRVEKAKELLTGSNLKIKEVCERLGYSNINYFIKVFKDATGVTPGDYRRMNQGRFYIYWTKFSWRER